MRSSAVAAWVKVFTCQIRKRFRSFGRQNKQSDPKSASLFFFMTRDQSLRYTVRLTSTASSWIYGATTEQAGTADQSNDNKAYGLALPMRGPPIRTPNKLPHASPFLKPSSRFLSILFGPPLDRPSPAKSHSPWGQSQAYPSLNGLGSAQQRHWVCRHILGTETPRLNVCSSAIDVG